MSKVGPAPGLQKEDFVVLSEFSEQEGPIPLIVYPDHAYDTFDINAFVLKIMAVDSQAQKTEPGVTPEDTQTMVLDPKEGFCAYVHHFTLHDVYARGYVRPVCASFVMYDKLKMVKNFEKLLVEFGKISGLMKGGNHKVFLKDLNARMRQLASIQRSQREGTHARNANRPTSSPAQSRSEPAAVVGSVSAEPDSRDTSPSRGSPTVDRPAGTVPRSPAQPVPLRLPQSIVTMNQVSMTPSAVAEYLRETETMKSRVEATLRRLHWSQSSQTNHGAASATGEQHDHGRSEDAPTPAGPGSTGLRDGLGGAFPDRKPDGDAADTLPSSVGISQTTPAQAVIAAQAQASLPTERHSLAGSLAQSLGSQHSTGSDQMDTLVGYLYRHSSFNKQLRTMEQLCGMDFRHALEALVWVQHYYSRPSAVLDLESQDIELLHPSASLLVIGRSVISNFASSTHDGARLEAVAIPQAEPLASRLWPTGAGQPRPSEEVDVILRGEGGGNGLPSDHPCTEEAAVSDLGRSTQGPGPALAKKEKDASSLAGLRARSLLPPASPLDVFTPGAKLVVPQTMSGPGAGLLRLRHRYVFLDHAIYALLVGRPLIVLGAPTPQGQTLVKRVVEALSLFVVGQSFAAMVVPWRDPSAGPVSVAELGHLRIVGQPRTLNVSSSVRQMASLLDTVQEVLVTPPYTSGEYIPQILGLRKKWRTEESYIAHVHALLVRIGAAAKVYHAISKQASKCLLASLQLQPAARAQGQPSAAAAAATAGRLQPEATITIHEDAQSEPRSGSSEADQEALMAVRDGDDDGALGPPRLRRQSQGKKAVEGQATASAPTDHRHAHHTLAETVPDNRDVVQPASPDPVLAVEECPNLNDTFGILGVHGCDCHIVTAFFDTVSRQEEQALERGVLAGILPPSNNIIHCDLRKSVTFSNRRTSDLSKQFYPSGKKTAKKHI